MKASESDENVLQLQQELLAVTKIADKCEWDLEMIRRGHELLLLRAEEEVLKVMS